MDSLAELIRRHIQRTYGGNQAAFARATGESPSTVNTWVKGTVGLPKPDTRRRLAKELGIRHVDILVAAGELWPEEVCAAPEPPRSEADDILSQFDPDTREDVLRMLRRFAQTKVGDTSPTGRLARTVNSD